MSIITKLKPEINLKHKVVLNINTMLLFALWLETKIDKDIEIKLEQSPNKNNSFYFYFIHNDYSTGLRISDHDTKLTEGGGGIRNIVIDEYSTYNMLYVKVKETIQALKKKEKHVNLEKLFDKIKH